ncbi:MAG: pilus assembly protein, partial [Burkholderiales bacterium]
WQHMTTYTIGLGASGTAPYDPDYLTNPDPFYLSVLGDANGNGSIDAGETTPGGWPIPDSDNDGAGDEDPATDQRTIDDLWHAAVNGHGQYFSAKDPTSLAIGMTSIVNDIIGRVSSGAGAGVAAPVITTTNNGVYTVTYKGGEWSGQVNKQTIDPNTGAVSSTPVWQARDQLNTLASSGGWDANRKIATLKSDGTKIPFRWANLSSTQQSTFGSTAGGQQQVVNWLRGDKSLEGVGAGKYRIRAHILGDIAGSEAVVVGKPTEKFNEIDNPGYSSFKSTQASRTEMVYVGANDGMLHAFDATTGAERWAYVPGILIRPGADGLAALSYQQGGTPPFNHHYYVDQTPQVQDIDFNKTFGASGAPDWRTILVGGLNKGGKGFYALDITNPSASDETDVANKILWEFTDPTTPDDMGYSFGRPLIAKTAAHGWVVIVSSGHNNVNGGGFVYVLNARTGALLHKLSTGQGTSANPSGLAKINGYQINDTDGTIQHIYGGDLFGNVWRWDVSSPSTSSWTQTLLATLTDSGGTPQPITTSPRLALDVKAAVPTRWVFVGTGKYLGIPDNTTTQTQTMYAIKDGGKTVPSNPPTPITRSNMTAITGVGSSTPITTQGWYYDLTAGERINVDPVPNQGIIAWVTTIPSTDPCSPGFSGRAYARKYATGESILVDGSGNLVASVFNQKGYLDVKFLMVNGKIRLYVVKPPDSATGIPPLDPLPTDPSAFGAGVGRVNWREILD